MSKSVDYTFYKPKNITDWIGNVISRDECDKLQVGDIVRLCICDAKDSSGWHKYYFEITKIDYYKYGNTSKIRKFHGKVQDTYVMDNWFIIGPDHTTTFRKEDILEIPYWKSNFNPLKKQSNLDTVTQSIHRQEIEDMKLYDYEDEKEQEKLEKKKIEKRETRRKRKEKEKIEREKKTITI